MAASSKVRRLVRGLVEAAKLHGSSLENRYLRENADIKRVRRKLMLYVGSLEKKQAPMEGFDGFPEKNQDA